MSKLSNPTATLRQASELVAHGLAPAAALQELEQVAARYAVAVTPDIAALIEPDSADDPIALQFIPSTEELVSGPGENADPIGDHAHSPVTGIVHRYPDRVLFKLVHVCAVYCRFCFRREMVGPGKASALTPDAYQIAIAYIRGRPEIWEVILTGGDPLMISPRRLAEVMADIAAIDHVKIIRLHTRVPVADPARITSEMIAALRVDGAATWVALHANHAKELTERARAACAGINAEALEALMRAFVECRIKPYYLHHGDLAPGTAHLRTTIERGQYLMRTLRGRVSGLCQPDYVLDIPGGYGKSPVGPSYVSVANSFPRLREPDGETRYRLLDYCGDVHLYPPKP